MNTEEWLAMVTSTEPLHPDLMSYVYETSFGIMLKHPLVFEMAVHPAMCNARYLQKTEMVAQAKAESDWHSVIWLHERPYRLDALMGIAYVMDDEDYWAMVQNVWVDSENIFQHLDDWMAIFASDRPGRDAMMSDAERKALAEMAEPITVYRGFVDDDEDDYSRVDGLSWSTSLERATWFAGRFDNYGNGEVAQGTVKHDDVVAYFLGRGESEIVVKDLGSVRITNYLRGAKPNDEETDDDE